VQFKWLISELYMHNYRISYIFIELVMIVKIQSIVQLGEKTLWSLIQLHYLIMAIIVM